MTFDEYKETMKDVLRKCTFRDCDPVEYKQAILRRVAFEN